MVVVVAGACRRSLALRARRRPDAAWRPLGSWSLGDCLGDPLGKPLDCPNPEGEVELRWRYGRQSKGDTEINNRRGEPQTKKC